MQNYIVRYCIHFAREMTKYSDWTSAEKNEETKQVTLGEFYTQYSKDGCWGGVGARERNIQLQAYDKVIVITIFI